MRNDWLKKWAGFLLAPAIGAVCGLVYGFMDEAGYLRLVGNYPPRVVTLVREMVDFALPAAFGILIGCGVNVLKKQIRLNKQLSMQNIKLQRDILITVLISEFLHEIRNPIHNLTAALEDKQRNLSNEQLEIIERSLKRFEQIHLKYRKWESIFENINPNESVLLRSWIDNFMEDKMNARLRELNVSFKKSVESIRAHVHPVLLEQCLITLFSNACDELSKCDAARSLGLSVHMLPGDQKNNIELKVTNNGRGFPPEVLTQQGRFPVSSRQGTGLGLLLLRKMIEQVGGDMRLSNTEGLATVCLYLPGEPV